MGGPTRSAPTTVRNSMRPPPRPQTSQASHIGRAPSPSESLVSQNGPIAGTKRKERDDEEDGGEETNIHVVVRCRGRSEREVRENSGVVVSTSGVKSKNVELSMGPNSVSNKTYHFDKVFSPAADQVIVYEDVVAPILSEMLAGFNCTIFAYGQTGTGKTYTMLGDMTDTFGLLSDAAGIIPRVLYSLFQKLELDEAECSVKCSFIELYNEELRDLLSLEEGVKLKIYDDASKKGHGATVVQGMEESHIKTAAEGIKLLRQGSYRRQVAATKCNDLSSRSHTVFTITTFIKKPNEAGEDYICAGKLNLVDLAGSENIQRSGAENKRAAEAGLINKSLLTLGRVINALVEKSPHIPYRESKLTRLLQDSLGGRTKTCIIATVSPAKSNLEETISTLDYAFRAKNIRNKPQVNSMISKKTLLKEFTSEIEKLKSELIATRQRNGVYLSNEQYEEMTVESESRRILSEEQKARIETLEISLRNKVQELYSLTNNFASLKKDSEATRTVLDTTSTLLLETEQALRNTESLLKEETTVSEMYHTGEEKLLGIGAELISTVKSSTADLDLVRTKVIRQQSLHEENKSIFQDTVHHIGVLSRSLDDQVSVLKQKHEELTQAATDQIQDVLSTEKTKLEGFQRLLASKSATLDRQQSVFSQRFETSKEDMNNVLEEIKVLREDVKEKIGQGLQGLTHAAAKISDEVISELDEFHTQLHTSYSGLGRDFKLLFEDLTRQLTTQKEESDRLRSALEAANRQNLETAKSVASQLQASIEEEREQAQQDRNRLVDQIRALVDNSAANQERRFESKFLATQTKLVSSTELFEEADRTYREGMHGWDEENTSFMDKIIKTREEMKGRMKRDWMTINSRNNSIQESTRAVHQETVRIVDAQMQDMATQMEALDGFVTRARQQNDAHHRQNAHEFRQISDTVKATMAEVSVELNQHKAGNDTIGKCFQDHIESIESHISDSHHDLRMELREITRHGGSAQLIEYTSTGETPAKKEWVYPSNLPRTESRESILAKLRGLPDPATVSKATSNGSKTPGRSPKKQISPRKFTSPSKMASPTKSKVYNDAANLATPAAQVELTAVSHAHPNAIPLEMSKTGLKEVDINVVSRPGSSSSNSVDAPTGLDFAKSLSGILGAPPLKRHATASLVSEGRVAPNTTSKLRRGKSHIIVAAAGVENLSQSIGIGTTTRRLRSSPPGQIL